MLLALSDKSRIEQYDAFFNTVMVNSMVGFHCVAAPGNGMQRQHEGPIQVNTVRAGKEDATGKLA